jgi:hypothetical protein
LVGFHFGQHFFFQEFLAGSLSSFKCSWPALISSRVVLISSFISFRVATVFAWLVSVFICWFGFQPAGAPSSVPLPQCGGTTIKIVALQRL